jgi:hypothetical protein
MTRTLLAAALAAAMLAGAASSFAEPAADTASPCKEAGTAAPPCDEATKPAPQAADPADGMGCMPGGGCCGTCGGDAAAAPEAGTPQGSGRAAGSCPCGKAKKAPAPPA